MSAHKEVVVEVEETVAVTGTVLLDAVGRNASNAINLDTLHVSAKKIRIFAIAAMVLDILPKTVNRLVHTMRLAGAISQCLKFPLAESEKRCHTEQKTIYRELHTVDVS